MRLPRTALHPASTAAPSQPEGVGGAAEEAEPGGESRIVEEASADDEGSSDAGPDTPATRVSSLSPGRALRCLLSRAGPSHAWRVLPWVTRSAS